MVDAVVSFVVEKLGDALIGETFFLLGVRRQVEGLRDQLIRMRCFLKDADAKEQQGNERVRNWIEEIRNVAYDAEDVVDTFVLKVDGSCKTGGTQNFVIRKALMVKNLRHLYKAGKEIQVIQARLTDISDSRIMYGINDIGDKEASGSNANQWMQQPFRNQYPHVEDDDAIGLEEHTKTLLTELMKDDTRRCVISVIAVGGLGKTTLAKKIYRHDAVKSHFDCCAWGFISQQLNLRGALSEIMKKSMILTDEEFEMIKELNVGDLVEKLYTYLQDKRYFVVIDDVWSSEDWNVLSPAFPNGKTGSKVLLTTRNKEVALRADPWSLHFEPQLLTDEESWKLLCIKAFPRNMTDTNCCPAGLEKLGKEMTCKCGGLPLAICILGGLLATKKTEIKEWEFVHRDVIAHIRKGKNGGVSGILALSYNDLPFHLKPCFLYLGLFPGDYAIPRKKLIQMWVAEGFIQHTNEDVRVTMEEVAKHHYLAELIQRCVVQADKDSTPGMDKACRVHDLMRDFCLSRAKEMNFIGIYDQQHPIGEITSPCSSTNTYRRLRRYAIHLNDQSRRSEFYFNNSDCPLRTLLVNIPEHFPFTLFNYQNFKLLRVLDLENVAILKPNITKQVSRLIHLRYLALDGLRDIPISSSIGNLRNLETLKLKSFCGCLPATTMRLVRLRHLEIQSGKVDEKFQVESLINLQTLERIHAGKWIRKGCFLKMPNLRKLGVWCTTLLQTGVILDEVADKQSAAQYHNPVIRSLFIHSDEIFPDFIFESLSCCYNLHKLDLSGRLNALNLQKYPPNLSKLFLYMSELEEDPMASLQHLPNLRFLSLNYAYRGEEMVCSAKGFPQLQRLHLFSLKQLKNWRIDQGGMPCLKQLNLYRCETLSMLPEGMRFITTLQELGMYAMPLEFKERVVSGVGEDWYKVQHISSIIIKENREPSNNKTVIN
ncbi:hypothetical protein MKX01_042581 [Papaver californicum]|nr:hypothetical protein MKX01_042581 [Papaver californicum]